MTTIQLVGLNNGNLLLTNDVEVPINISIVDIRDISKRNGVFSKTITIPGTSENNVIFGFAFDVNVDSLSYDVNKLQACIVKQNGVSILENAYLQLISVRKRQNVQTYEDIIEYDVVIKDEVSNFFTKIGGKELSDIPKSNLAPFTTVLNSGNIISSFENTSVDKFKYFLPWTGLQYYMANELPLALYAKTLWDLIHETNGYSYTWDGLDDQFVQFDNMLVTDNKNTSELVESLNEDNQVIAKISATSSIQVDYELPTADSYDDAENWKMALYLSYDEKDVYNNFTTYLNGTGPYTPSAQSSTSLTVTSVPVSPSQAGYSVWNSPFHITPGTVNVSIRINFQFYINNGNAFPIFAYAPDVPEDQQGIDIFLKVENITQGTDFLQYIRTVKPCDFSYPANSDLLISTGTNNVNIDMPYGEPGDDYTFSLITRITQAVEFTSTTIPPFFLYDVTPHLLIKDCSIDIKLLRPTVGTNINPANYIPKKIKQSDFIKSITTLFNLYCIPDKDNPYNLIWVQRDKFYDSGIVKDWTRKLAKEQNQEIIFIPELAAKTITLTYKNDKDPANVTYNNATKEIYGQQKVVFSSEWLKNDEVKEVIFSPTPMQPSNWGGICPLYDNGDGEYNIRLLLNSENIYSDNVFAGFNQPLIVDYIDISPVSLVGTSSNVYPLMSHSSSPFGGNYDINFGVCDFYFFDAYTYTQNNLYNLNWRRTMSQLDSGKMLIAYFNLNEVDIMNINLNDKIKINNTYWNINKIIDYDGNQRKLTKVELISIDSDLVLTNKGRNTKVIIRLDKNSFKANQQQEKARKNLYTSSINTDQSVISLGERNTFNNEFNGIVVGNDIQPTTTTGIFVGELSITPETGLTTPGYLINDGGLDAV